MYTPVDMDIHKYIYWIIELSNLCSPLTTAKSATRN